MDPRRNTVEIPRALGTVEPLLHCPLPTTAVQHSAETKKWLYLITDGSSTPAKGSLSLSHGIVLGIFLWWQKADGPFLVFVAYG